MSKQLDINSEDSDDRQLLDLNKLLEAVMSEDNRTQVLNIVKELEECTAPNFAALPFESKFLITELFFLFMSSIFTLIEFILIFINLNFIFSNIRLLYFY
jgi:hypothetical protein